jgi:hypothetical protein
MQAKNPTTFTITDPSTLSPGVAPATPAMPLLHSATAPTQQALASLPKAAGTNVGQFDLLAAIDKAATPSARQTLQHSLPSTTAWAMPDVSHLPPQATPAAIPHDWLTNLLTSFTTWLQHLLSAAHLTGWATALPNLLSGLTPLLLGFLGIKALQTVFTHAVPRTRAAGEYANYGALDDAVVQRAQAGGVTGVVVDADGNVHIPRYHLGTARRAGLKGH